MGKKSKSKKPSKADLKALKKREAKLLAEIAEREAAAKKAAKRKGKKSKHPTATEAQHAADKKLVKSDKKGGKVKGADEGVTVAGNLDGAIEDLSSDEAAAIKSAKAERAARRAELAQAETPAEVAERAKPLKGKALKAALEADTKAGAERKKAALEETDDEIRARVQAKREARAGSPERLQGMADEVAAQREKRHVREVVTEIVDEVAQAASEAAHVAEVIETEAGREFAVGSPDTEEFGRPSEAPKRLEDNVNGNGQYKIKTPDGKERGYTRVTTYIDCLEDKTQLQKWKARIMLEGVAAVEDLVATGSTDLVAVTSTVRDLVHRRDVALKKARKADKKGELAVGQLQPLTDSIWSEFKKGLDVLADEVFEIGGGREKAAKGTDIHALCATAVAEGIDVVGDMLTRGEITPADLADVEAFLDALRRLEAKVIATERVVVDDENRVAGRLDYVLMVKLPGMQRATRLVADLKTGNVEYNVGKIAQQLEKYAGAVGYDEATGEREDLKLSRTKALLLHLPAGSAKARAHIVDLGLGRKGNALAKEVRAWRNEGKRAIDLKQDILTASAAE